MKSEKIIKALYEKRIKSRTINRTLNVTARIEEYGWIDFIPVTLDVDRIKVGKNIFDEDKILKMHTADGWYNVVFIEDKDGEEVINLINAL